MQATPCSTARTACSRASARRNTRNGVTITRREAPHRRWILTELRLQNSQQTCPARSTLFVVKKQRKTMTNMKATDVTTETAPDADVFPRDAPVRCVRSGSPLTSNLPRASACRVYLQRLRAAEMAAWEQTGGDYLRSDYAHAGLT